MEIFTIYIRNCTSFCGIYYAFVICKLISAAVPFIEFSTFYVLAKNTQSFITQTRHKLPLDKCHLSAQSGDM
jgi:hypothetical protein